MGGEVVSCRKRAFAGSVTIMRWACARLPHRYGGVRQRFLYNSSVKNLTAYDLDYIFQNIETSLSVVDESIEAIILRKASQPR